MLTASITYSGMSRADIERFRQQAEDARQHAQKAINPLDKKARPRLSGEWTKLAQEAEERRNKR